jgi:uncharacterized protein DUF6950
MPSSPFPAERVPGWEDRLAAAIADARVESYALGRHDCFRLACRVIEALVGVDPWPAWAGTYASRREALRRIAEYHEDGFTAAASRFFGGAPQPMELARRGDLCEFIDSEGAPHLGVVLGAEVALLGPEGLVFVRRDACPHHWRVG